MSFYRFLFGILALFGTIGLMAADAYSPIAYGVKSRGMGGVGIAVNNGAQSGFENPALLSLPNKNEIYIGTTYIKTDRKISYLNEDYNYDDDKSFIPNFAFNYKIKDNISFGLTASSYKLSASIENFKSSIKKIRIGIPISYKYKNLSMGISLIGEKERFKISLDSNGVNVARTDYGYIVGAAYNFPQTGVILAINYKSKIKHSAEFENENFYINSPSEAGIGLSWKIFGSSHSIGIDYKKIYSSQIFDPNPTNESYTKNQNSFAIGYSYDVKKWSIRAGYKYIDNLYTNHAIIGYDISSFIFPFESKSHYTVGGSYRFNSNFSMDLAFVYAPFKGTNADYENKYKATSMSLGINYSFN